jgi:lycopene cyclase domain-containing protein
VGYLDFHMSFIIPPLALLWVLVADMPSEQRRRAGRAAGLLAGLATLWATPWDNYMVATGVWDYPADGVLGIIGYIPIEEQLFFVFQPLMTVALLVLLRGGRTVTPDPERASRDRWVARGLAAGTLVVSGAAIAIHLAGRAPYLTATLGWFGPVLAFQVYVGGCWLVGRGRLVATATLAPTFYLCLVDAMAIDQGRWTINPAATVGLEWLGLPLEEAVFFLVTNALVVCGALLYLDWYDWLHGTGASRSSDTSRGGARV